MPRLALLVLLPLALAACSNQGLRDLRSNSSGPDEFLVQPVRALEEPASYSALPTPTPGQGNLTDRSALAEGDAALGGTHDTRQNPIPASDGALVNHTSRLGRDPGVRADLAEKDERFRKRQARFTQFRIVPVDRYNQAYRRQTLDQDAEARRWRRAGARTASFPPGQ